MDQVIKKTDKETALLKGPVKQVMGICYKAHTVDGTTVQGKIEDHPTYYHFNSIMTFNKEGIKIKDEGFGTYEHTVTILNEKRLPLESKHFNPNGTLKYSNTYIYNDKDLMVENISVNADGSPHYRTTTSYNEQGKTLEHFHYHGANGDIISHNVYTYDEQGNPLSVMQYGREEKLRHRTVYKYNDKGQKIEEISENVETPNSDYNRRLTYEYNEYGDVAITNVYRMDGSLKDTYVNNYKYDSEGKKIIPPHPPYDPYALKEGETELREEDAHGNWTKRTIFFNKRATNILVRLFSYYGEPSENQPPFVHPITTSAPGEVAEKKRDYSTIEELKPEQAQWMVEAPTSTGDNFSALRYYVTRFNEHPSVIAYTGPHIEALALRQKLIEYVEAEEIHSYNTCWNSYEHEHRYTLAFRGQPYLLQATGISSQDDDDFMVPSFIEKINDHTGNVHISQIMFYRPSDASGKRDDYLEEMVSEYIEECSLEKKPEKPTIRTIEVRNNNFAMVERPVDDKFEIQDLDVNYGQGFKQFHNQLIQRFHTQSKGLVLFHGQPGTGKTYYIRHLLRQMAVGKRKIVIYMPPNMVDHLVEPAFMTFLSNEIENWSEDGLFTVLLIEDAEPLLAKRQEGVRIQGVTNLLNMSDGLLNDMLNLQIICTFNVDLKKLDSALLRPGRLLARKEFKALSVLDANLLAQRLGIKHHFTKPATLAEVYSMAKDKNTLVHEVDPDQDTSTLLDDLLN